MFSFRGTCKQKRGASSRPLELCIFGAVYRVTSVMWSDSTSPPPARLSTRAPQLTLLRHAGHGRELRQNPRAVPQPSGPWPPLPSSGAGVPTTVVHVRADAAVCTSARLGARRAHSRRCAGVVDALLGDALRWRRVFLHWYARRPGSGEVLPAVLVRVRPAQHWSHRVLAGGLTRPVEDDERRGTLAPSEGLPAPRTSAGASCRRVGA